LNLSAMNIEGQVTDKLVSGKFIDCFTSKPKDFSKERSFQLKAWDYLIYEK